MKTCKDCYHQKACQAMLEVQGYSVSESYRGDATRCDTFKDKSLVLDLPCKVGDTVYMPQRAAFPKGVVSAIHLNGRRSHIMIDVDFHFRAKHYLDEYGITWFTSPESAEQALKEREQG